GRRVRRRAWVGRGTDPPRDGDAQRVARGPWGGLPLKHRDDKHREETRESVKERVGLVEALAESPSPEHVARLVAWGRDPAAEVRTAAGRALGMALRGLGFDKTHAPSLTMLFLACEDGAVPEGPLVTRLLRCGILAVPVLVALVRDRGLDMTARSD